MDTKCWRRWVGLMEKDWENTKVEALLMWRSRNANKTSVYIQNGSFHKTSTSPPQRKLKVNPLYPAQGWIWPDLGGGFPRLGALLRGSGGILPQKILLSQFLYLGQKWKESATFSCMVTRIIDFWFMFFPKGLGAKESHDNDWIAQQADFNNLLSALQEHSGNAG